MAGECLDNCLSIDANDNAFKERTRIAEVASATLCRLNSIMKQMKDWREDRAKLKCNICRLKMALRAVDKETGDALKADPLIEHQRLQITRLNIVNESLRNELSHVKMKLMEKEKNIAADNTQRYGDRLSGIEREFSIEKENLNNEILYLKSRLREAEDEHVHSSAFEHLRCKLKQFMMGDQTMEIIFTDLISKVAETIANLSEELVNLSEDLRGSEARNDDLYFEIDKLKAMLRSKIGNSEDYRGRIEDLNSITESLRKELERFKGNLGGKPWKISGYKGYALWDAERLANELKNKLRNDREALLSAGDPDCLKYMMTITELRMKLKYFHIELEKSSSARRLRSRENNVEHEKYFKQVSAFNDTLNEITGEVDKLRDDQVVKQCRINGFDSMKYLKKIEDLERTVEKTKTAIGDLNYYKDDDVIDENHLNELESLVGKIYREIKDLDVMLTKNNYSSLFKRIEQLEESVVRTRVELKERENCAVVFRQKFADAKTLLEQKIKEATETRRTVASLTEANKTLAEKVKTLEEKILEASREQENSGTRHGELQQVRYEADVMRKKLENLEADKESLAKETEMMRDVLVKRNDEIAVIVAERNATVSELNAEISTIKMKLECVATENETLRARLENSGRGIESETLDGTIIPSKEHCDTKHSTELTEKVEVERLKTELETSVTNLDQANREIVDLKTKLERLSTDNVKLQTNICHLESKKEILVYQLAVEKTTIEERIKEMMRLTSDCREREIENGKLRNENEQLRTELAGLNTKMELLQGSMDDMNAKYPILEDRANKYRSERDALRNEISNLQTTASKLTSKLTELDNAREKTRRLETENKGLANNLGDLAIKNAAVEKRVQVLLTEKNHLTTRINELNLVNVGLTEQLNNAHTTNERSAVELEKSRIEIDKARTRSAALQNALDEMKSTNETLRKTNDELTARVNEIQSEYRILYNRLTILQMKNDDPTMDRDSVRHGIKNYYDRFNRNLGETERTNVSKATLNELDDRPEHPMIREKSVKRERIKSSSNSRTKNDEKPKIKDKNRDASRRLRAENEVLRFELMNLKNQNSEVRMELCRTKDEFQKLLIEFQGAKTSDTVAIRPVSNKLEIVNLYYKQRVDSYSTLDNRNSSTRNSLAGMEMERMLCIINKLKIENVALRIEVNALRCNYVAKVAGVRGSWNELRNATDEIQALKSELAKQRDENERLLARLDVAGAELHRVKSEKIALRDELNVLRRTNSDLRRRASELRDDYEKLRERSGENDGGRLIGMSEKIKGNTTVESSDTAVDRSGENLESGDTGGDVKEIVKLLTSELDGIENNILIRETN